MSRGVRRSVSVGVVLFGLFAAVLPVSPGAAERSANGTVNDAALFHFFIGTARYSRSEAVEIARGNRLVIAHAATFRDHVGAMKSANPDLRLLVYRKGVMAWRDEGSAFPESWYLVNAAGQKVRSDPWGSYLMDPRVPGWAGVTADDCTQEVERSGYDGCYLDVSGIGALFISDSVPLVEPGGPVFTQEAFHDALVQWAGRVREYIPASVDLMTNSIGAGRRYWDERWPSVEIAEASGSGHAEVWLRLAHHAIDEFRSVREYRWELDLLVDAARRGVEVLVSTKVWVPGTATEIDRWRHYSYATFLLGTDGSHYWAFTSEQSSPDESDHPLYAMDIGSPTGQYGEAGGLFYRTFDRGFVVVNPQDTVRALDLPGRFVDVTGRARETVRMDPNTALVLQWQGTGPAPDYGDTPPTSPGISLTCNGELATIMGTNDDDVIQGTAGRDIISAGRGDDIIRGVGGDDLICGGGGRDRLEGGAGNDVIFGGDGADDIRGHSGDDLLYGNAGNDEIYGHDGRDTVFGGTGGDVLNGGRHLDECDGDAGPDRAGSSCETQISIER